MWRKPELARALGRRRPAGLAPRARNRSAQAHVPPHYRLVRGHFHLLRGHRGHAARLGRTPRLNANVIANRSYTSCFFQCILYVAFPAKLESGCAGAPSGT